MALLCYKDGTMFVRMPAQRRASRAAVTGLVVILVMVSLSTFMPDANIIHHPRLGWLRWLRWLEYDTRHVSIVVMGTARDIAFNDAANLVLLRRLARTFNLMRVIVFEDGSKDKTLSKLRAWETTLNLGIVVDVLSEAHVPGGRTVRLAYARNAMWRQLRASTSPQPDFVLMVDLDGVSNSLKGVDKCLDLPLGWGACCTNNRQGYYDLWALRTFDDCGLECNNDFTERPKHLSATAAPIKVESCFGGAALYNVRTINGSGEYSGVFRGREQCEHVAFSQALGAPLYIQPGMLNA